MGRRRHDGNRDQPEPSRCLGVFGLSLYTTEKELEKEFSRYGPMDKVQVVLDGHSGRSRGFAFIYFENVDDATEARNKMTGTERQFHHGFHNCTCPPIVIVPTLLLC